MDERQQFLDAIAAAPEDEAPKKVYADWLDERGEHDEATAYRGWTAARSIPKELDDYDWHATFAFAGEEGAGTASGPKMPEAARPGSSVSVAPFARKDVKRVVAKSEGTPDEVDWVCVGELWDGRFFAVRAGCDYTGWG